MGELAGPADELAGGHRLVAGDLSIDVLEFGATIQRLHVRDRGGIRRNVVLGHATVADYRASTAYFGGIIGRYANRIAGARLRLDGQEFPLQANETSATLHGGPDGFHLRTWTVVDRAVDRITLELVSPDGDGGFPGELTVQVTYAVSPGQVRIDLTAHTDAPTVVNLTNHTYVNLEGEDSPTVDRHLLQIRADRYLPTGAGGIPTGELALVEGTPFDLREPALVGERRRAEHPQVRAAAGLDHTFVVPGSGLREHARLVAPRTGLALTVRSDQPGIQVYSGGHLRPHPLGTSGRPYGPAAGIALETQHFPDSPNHPHFPSTVLRPGETFASTTTWDFETLG